MSYIVLYSRHQIKKFLRFVFYLLKLMRTFYDPYDNILNVLIVWRTKPFYYFLMKLLLRSIDCPKLLYLINIIISFIKIRIKRLFFAKITKTNNLTHQQIFECLPLTNTFSILNRRANHNYCFTVTTRLLLLLSLISYIIFVISIIIIDN